MIRVIQSIYTSMDLEYPSHMKVFRFIVSGGTAAAVDLAFLYIFTSVIHIWYLISAILAFLIAFGVSFVLQKFWTFRDHSNDKVHSQALVYLIVTSVNLGLNTLFMYALVDYAHFNYMLSQIIASAIIAVESYFVYQIFVFQKPTIS